MTRPRGRFLDPTTPPNLFTLVMLASLGSLAVNVFLPSLPNMTEWFDTEYAIMQLSVSLYLAANAMLQIVIGPISDRFGRRPVILTAIVLFLLATIGCLMATTAEVFLFFRICQAVIVTALALSRAAVRDMVGEDEAASMIGYVTMGMALVPMIAPMIGGVLDHAFGWHASFFLMLFFGMAVFILAWLDLGETATGRAASFREQFEQYPELFRSRRFWGYCAAASFTSGAFFAFLGGAPLVGSREFNLSPTVFGLYFGFAAAGYGVGNFLSGRYSVRLGINQMVLAGAIVTVSALVAMSLAYGLWDQSPLLFFGVYSFVGVGNGMVLPNATSGMLSVRPQLAGTASGLGGAMTIGGGAALSAITGAWLAVGPGAWPLLIVMLASAVMGLAAILYVIRRQKQLNI